MYNGAYDFDCRDVKMKDQSSELRSENDIVFERKKPLLFKLEQVLFFRSGALVNRLPRSVEFTDQKQLKKTNSFLSIYTL